MEFAVGQPRKLVRVHNAGKCMMDVIYLEERLNLHKLRWLANLPILGSKTNTIVGWVQRALDRYKSPGAKYGRLKVTVDMVTPVERMKGS